MNTTPSLIEVIERKLEKNEVDLPVFDGIALEVHREVREQRLDADGLCRILERDASLVSEVLRMANSSFFSGLSEIRGLRDATVRLGVKQVASIVFSVSQKRLYSASNGPFKARLLRLWQHASAVSMGARWVALHGGYRNLAEEAFVAGLLHDIGKLSLLRIIENIATSDEASAMDERVELALDRLHCTHGARLLELWNVPEVFRHAVLHLEDETISEGALVLAIVRLVDRVCAVEGLSDRPDANLSLEDLAEARMLRLSAADIAELRLFVANQGEGESSEAA